MNKFIVFNLTNYTGDDLANIEISEALELAKRDGYIVDSEDLVSLFNSEQISTDIHQLMSVDMNEVENLLGYYVSDTDTDLSSQADVLLRADPEVALSSVEGIQIIEALETATLTVGQVLNLI